MESIEGNESMTELTESDKRRLTEWMGYQPGWYCTTGGCTLDKWRDGDCKSCENRETQYSSFDTPDDFFALKDKLVEKGEWGGFFRFIQKQFLKEHHHKLAKNNTITDWLIHPVRFPQLVNEYLKEK
jgi:hypothetical protein